MEATDFLSPLPGDRKSLNLVETRASITWRPTYETCHLEVRELEERRDVDATANVDKASNSAREQVSDGVPVVTAACEHAQKEGYDGGNLHKGIYMVIEDRTAHDVCTYWSRLEVNLAAQRYKHPVIDWDAVVFNSRKIMYTDISRVDDWKMKIS